MCMGAWGEAERGIGGVERVQGGVFAWEGCSRLLDGSQGED